MAPEQRYPVRRSATLADGDDGEGTTTAGLPIDGQILRVGFYEIRVPCVLGYAEAIVALLTFRGLSEDVASYVLVWRQRSRISRDIRYLEARTNLPAIADVSFIIQRQDYAHATAQYVRVSFCYSFRPEM